MYKYTVQGDFNVKIKIKEHLISNPQSNGTSCTGNVQCISGLCYKNKCSDKFDYKQACSNDWECKSDYCNANNCDNITKENGKCTVHNQCETKKCDSIKKICVKKSGNESCVKNSECKSNKCKMLKCLDDGSDESP